MMGKFIKRFRPFFKNILPRFKIFPLSGSGRADPFWWDARSRTDEAQTHVPAAALNFRAPSNVRTALAPQVPPNACPKAPSP